jgi:uncharacterized protein (DUF58 family)
MPDPMEGPARTRLVALVVILVLAVPLTIVAIAGSGGGDGNEEPEIRVERSPEVFEVRVFVEPEVNVRDRTRGRSSVTVECLDRSGAIVASQVESWPFTDTDGNTLDPHAHVPINPARIEDVSDCRIRPAQPPLRGPVT